jgi:hypothetical protein
MKKLLTTALAAFAISSQAQVIDFENFSTLTGWGSVWNGSGKSIKSVITSGGANFATSFTTGVKDSDTYWGKWTYSKVKNTTLAGFTNDRASATGGGAENSNNYAVSYGSSNILTFSELVTVSGLQVSNATYPYLSMKDGDSFAKKFGGTSGDDPDYFKLTIQGYQGGILNTLTGVDVMLADFTSSISGNDFILNTWQIVDLTTLGGVDSLKFSLSSTDNGGFGMNTPAYFVLDNITSTGSVLQVADFENYTLSSTNFFKAPDYTNSTTLTSSFARFENSFSYFSDYDYTSWSGFAISKVNNTTLSGIGNQYASAAGKGFNGSDMYAISYSSNEISFTTAQSITGFYATNTAYAYWSMKDGDSFAKKFGGNSGTEPDFFKLIVKGYRNGVAVNDSVTHFLADFTSSISGEDFISSEWKWVDLSKLGSVDKITFKFSSSDVGSLGMNTPAYFAMDNFNGVAPLVSTTGLAQTSINQFVHIYPNPTNGYFQISGIEGKLGVEIVDFQGKNVLQLFVNQADKIDISNLSQGMYLVKISTEKGDILLKKLIKE